MCPAHNHNIFYHDFPQHRILDCGIEIFNKVSDYPENFLDEYLILCRELTQQFPNMWCVIPDYCDDLAIRQPQNVEKTARNIKRFKDEPGVFWVPVIQAQLHNYLSFTNGVQTLKHLYPTTPKVIAIGTVCKSKRLRYIEWCAKYARHHFPQSHIHMFGLTLSALPRVKGIINSWDSTAFTWAFAEVSKNHRRQAAEQSERVTAFHLYTERIGAILT
jgi:hypothetical protein